MDGVRIVHLSDLHISEHLLRTPDSHFKLPHRYGHDVQIFLALDAFLRNTDWDILAITGDLTRIGNSESFEIVRNWLENKINIGNIEVGQQLSARTNRHYVVIPGNHDRFGGGLDQGSLDKYHNEFDPIRPGTTKEIDIRGQRVRFHLFDSSWEKGGFAIGKIYDQDLVPRQTADDVIEIGLLHHHFIQAPSHQRESGTELDNSAEVAAFMLNSNFNGVMFGHTHQSYIGIPSVEALTGILHDRRAQGKFWRKLAPRYLLRMLSDDGLVSYKRQTARNGQYPKLEAYFNYLFLKKSGYAVQGPSSFCKIRDFYLHLESQGEKDGIKEVLERLKSKRILISLAPSACQAEAKQKGFHIVSFHRGKDPDWERYAFKNSGFVRVKERPRK